MLSKKTCMDVILTDETSVFDLTELHAPLLVEVEKYKYTISSTNAINLI